MAIEVELPDGTIVEFPDGTDDATMERALAEYAAPKAAQPKRRDAVEQVGHDLSYGARSVLENAGGTVDFFTEPLHRGFEAIGLPQQRFRDLGRMASDAVGLAQPETPTERISSDVTGALTATLTGSGAARLIDRAAGPVMQGVKTFFGAQPGTQAAGAATGAGAAGAVRESGGSEGEQMTAGILGALLPGASTYAGAGALRRTLRGDGGNVYTPGELAAMGYQKGDVAENALAQLIAFRRAGINNPTVGQVGQTPFARTMESGLSQFPGSAHIYADVAQGQIDDATRTINGMTRGAGPTSAGNAIKQGQQDFASRLRDVDTRVYAPVDAAMNGQPVRIENTLATLRAAANPAPSTPAVSARLGNKTLRNVLDDLMVDSSHSTTYPGITPPRTIPFEGLKSQRTAVGELIGEAGTRDVGAGPKQLSRAYGAMSEDMLAGARAVGPGAEAALTRANRVHSTGMGREQVLRDAVRDGIPEDVFRRATAGMAEGGTELRTIMKSLGPEQRREVARAVIRDLGWVAKGAQDATGDTFAATTFKNNWANLSDEAKGALFDNLPAAERRQLQALADVGRNIQDGSRVFANPAGTAGKSALYTLATTAPAAAVTTGSIVPLLVGAGAPVAANGLARLMTGKGVIGVGANLPQVITRRTTKPYGIFAPQASVESQRRPRSKE